MIGTDRLGQTLFEKDRVFCGGHTGNITGSPREGWVRVSGDEGEFDWPCEKVEKLDRSFLEKGEVHPMADDAMHYLAQRYHEFPLLLDSFSSCAIEGNRLGEVCAGTLRRLMKGQPVSDRYALGLAWAIRDLETNENNKPKLN